MPDTSQPTALRTPDWYRTATRWTQLTLAEDDPVRFDPEVWIDLFRRTRSNATCLSAGGYIAYYPSQVPLHYVSRFIGETDPFGTLVAGARVARHARHGPRRPARHPPGRGRRPSGMDRGRQGGPPAPALGLSRMSG